jgi:hypothetical protein
MPDLSPLLLVKLTLVVGYLLFASMVVLWIVMPGGVEPGTEGKLMWRNLLPWSKGD